MLVKLQAGYGEVVYWQDAAIEETVQKLGLDSLKEKQMEAARSFASNQKRKQPIIDQHQLSTYQNQLSTGQISKSARRKAGVAKQCKTFFWKR